jgi:hypothetical protein
VTQIIAYADGWECPNCKPSAYAERGTWNAADLTEGCGPLVATCRRCRAQVLLVRGCCQAHGHG